MKMMTPDRNNRILIIDDNPAIHEDFRKILVGFRNAGSDEMDAAESLLFGSSEPVIPETQFELESAFQGEEGLEKVRAAHNNNHPYAVAFVDIRMPPGWDGVETITRLWQVDPTLQVVICTAYSDYSWREITSSIGHSDNMVVLKKPFDNIEVMQLAHSLTTKWHLTRQAQMRMQDLDKMVTKRTRELQLANENLRREIQERVHAEDALKLSEERFSKAFKASPMPMAIQTLDKEIIIDVNEGFKQMTGFEMQEILHRKPSDLNLWVDSQSRTDLMERVRANRSVREFETQIRSKDGGICQCVIYVEVFTLVKEQYMLVIFQDISERVTLENQLRQAQKMEAVGQLAAGVAHDFNNLLTIIQGHASMRLAKSQLDTETTKSIELILDAAKRGSSLTRQLLIFSRKQIIQLKVVSVNDLVQEVSKMLQRLIGEQVSIKYSFHRPLPPIFADPCNVEQILINLAVNSRDATPPGGTIYISTAFLEIDATEAQRRHPESRPGAYVCLSVKDTGSGMDETTQKRIFEPFFTTKEVGKGTGMGLATVYGIVKQHHGWIELDTQLNYGSEFRIYFPICEKDTAKKTDEVAPPPAKVFIPTGEETILLVEDENEVREIVRRVLEDQGYRVLLAQDGQEAIGIWQERVNDINLLLTDVVMPGGMSGRELAEMLIEQKKDLNVIYISGYNAELLGEDMKIFEGRNFLPKPFPPQKLIQAVGNCFTNGSN